MNDLPIECELSLSKTAKKKSHYSSHHSIYNERKKNSLIKNFVAKLKSKTKPPFTETVNPKCPARYLL